MAFSSESDYYFTLGIDRSQNETTSPRLSQLLVSANSFDVPMIPAWRLPFLQRSIAAASNQGNKL